MDKKDAGDPNQGSPVCLLIAHQRFLAFLLIYIVYWPIMSQADQASPAQDDAGGASSALLDQATVEC